MTNMPFLPPFISQVVRTFSLPIPHPSSAAMTSRPSPQQPTKRLPKPGLQGPEKQLLDAKLLELQLGLLSLDEVRTEWREGGRGGRGGQGRTGHHHQTLTLPTLTTTRTARDGTRAAGLPTLVQPRALCGGGGGAGFGRTVWVPPLQETPPKRAPRRRQRHPPLKTAQAGTKTRGHAPQASSGSNKAERHVLQ